MAQALLASRSAVTPPPFQRLSKDDAVKITRPYSLTAWAGDKERILALQKLLEDALERAYNAAVTELTQGPTDPDTTGLRAYRTERLADDYALRVEVTGRGGRWTREGELSAIFDDVELDLRDSGLVPTCDVCRDRCSEPVSETRYTRKGEDRAEQRERQRRAVFRAPYENVQPTDPEHDEQNAHRHEVPSGRNRHVLLRVVEVLDGGGLPELHS